MESNKMNDSNEDMKKDEMKNMENNNRIDVVRSDDAFMNTQPGPDMSDEIYIRTTGSDQMASGGLALAHMDMGDSSIQGSSNLGTGRQMDIEEERQRNIEEAKADTGKPTGAIHGREGDIKAVKNKFKK